MYPIYLSIHVLKDTSQGKVIKEYKITTLMRFVA